MTAAPWAALWDPLSEEQPAGVSSSYFCADCPPGAPQKLRDAEGRGPFPVWGPWCDTPAGQVCPA